jgi:hypothetical protein
MTNTTLAELIKSYPNDSDLGGEIRKLLEFQVIEETKRNNIQLPEVDRVTRLEVINHAKNSMQVGRLLTVWKEMGDFEDIDFDLQDNGRTLKIFLN